MTASPVAEPPGDRPFPSPDLIWRVAGTSDVAHFDSSGRQSVEDLRAALRAVKSDLDSHRAILDFGCGCGRVLRWLDGLPADVALHGCDIDAEAVAWVADNLPHVRVTTNEGTPPLPFDADAFDVVFNHSVFTHLPEDYQDAWLAELNRVVRPDGIVVLTVAADHPFAGLLATWRDAGEDPSAWERLYREKGFVYVANDSWTGGPFPDFYHSTFHAPWYVFEHWSQFLDIQAYIVRGALDFQDIVVLRPREET